MRGQIRLLEFGNRLTCGASVRAEGQDTLLDERFLGCTIDTAAQHRIELGRFALSRWPVAQGNMLQLAGFGIDDEKVLGIRQMRFDARLEAVRHPYGNT